ncbi:MAG: LOG family protein [Candidatus Omnitrophica bacterium]|nr:LOG family protein [Candidatus Omnitrophota bacterium]
MRPAKVRVSVRCVAVLGSGTIREGSRAYDQAVLLGKELGERGFCVCHGGYGGVMEAVARGVKMAGGRNVGVTIGRSLKNVNPWTDEAIQMPSWEKRLLKLVEKGDAYVFLDGATGTLNELFFIWEMANKKLHQKPIMILGGRLRRLIRTLKKDPGLRVPPKLCMVTSVPEAVRSLVRAR